MPEQPIQKRRVLVIDDEPSLTELLSLELDVEGYDVDIASDGAAGLIRSRSEPTPDLIILDWNLPDSLASTSARESGLGGSALQS